MRFDVFYLARPTPELHAAVVEWPSEIREIFTTSLSALNGEGGRSGWNDADHTDRMKLLLQLNLYDNLSTSPEVRQFFHSARISLATFDRFWTLERYVPDFSSESLGSTMAPRLAELVDRTGNPLVDAWLGMASSVE